MDMIMNIIIICFLPRLLAPALLIMQDLGSAYYSLIVDLIVFSNTCSVLRELTESMSYSLVFQSSINRKVVCKMSSDVIVGGKSSLDMNTWGINFFMKIFSS